MTFVLDASVTACWAFSDEDHPVAALALERIRREDARVPAIWWFEIRNTLLVNERRGRLQPADTSRFLSRLAALPIAIDRAPDDAAVLAVAREHRLTIYDASYLELADRHSIVLATLDHELAVAARARNVSLLQAGQVP